MKCFWDGYDYEYPPSYIVAEPIFISDLGDLENEIKIGMDVENFDQMIRWVIQGCVEREVEG